MKPGVWLPLLRFLAPITGNLLRKRDSLLLHRVCAVIDVRPLCARVRTYWSVVCREGEPSLVSLLLAEKRFLRTIADNVVSDGERMARSRC